MEINPNHTTKISATQQILLILTIFYTPSQALNSHQPNRAWIVDHDVELTVRHW